MNKLLLNFALIGIAIVGLSACGSGSTTQNNMPIGGSPFTGTFSFGIGNASGINTCTNNGAESLTFVVQSGGSTSFYDNSLTANSLIITGSFANNGQAVSQNNPCFTGTVSYSPCGAANQGNITFYGCSVSLVGSSYIFNASYSITPANSSAIVISGTINAVK